MTKTKELRQMVGDLRKAIHFPQRVAFKFTHRAGQIVITAQSSPRIKHPLNTYITFDSFLQAFQIKQKGYVIALLPALGSCELYRTDTILKIATPMSVINPIRYD